MPNPALTCLIMQWTRIEHLLCDKDRGRNHYQVRCNKETDKENAVHVPV